VGLLGDLPRQEEKMLCLSQYTYESPYAWETVDKRKRWVNLSDLSPHYT